MSKKKAASESPGIPIARAPKSSDGYAILNSLVSHVAVLSTDGTILFTNHAWNRFAQQNGNPPPRKIGPGVNYLEVCSRAASNGAPGADATLAGVRNVLEGKQDSFSIEYSCDSPAEQRWFTMNVAPLEGTKGSAVISHVDITRGRLAEKRCKRATPPSRRCSML